MSGFFARSLITKARLIPFPAPAVAGSVFMRRFKIFLGHSIVPTFKEHCLQCLHFSCMDTVDTVAHNTKEATESI